MTTLLRLNAKLFINMKHVIKIKHDEELKRFEVTTSEQCGSFSLLMGSGDGEFNNVKIDVSQSDYPEAYKKLEFYLKTNIE